MVDDTSLAAHTPSPEYMRNILVRRALELLGTDKKAARLIAPEPYKSKYPSSNKLLDAILALSLDPVIKPASLQGKLKTMPALDRLANELANKGYYRRYPGGGIGIGSGGGGDDPGEGEPATSPPPQDIPTLPAVTVIGDRPGAEGPDSPGPPGEPAPPPGDPASSQRINIDDIAKMADKAPLSWSRALDALKGVIGFGPASGTTAGRGAAAFGGITGMMPGVPSPFGGVLGAAARGAAGDAASRASTALGNLGFAPNPTTIDAVISAMAGPSPGVTGDQGGGTIFDGAVSPRSEVSGLLTGSGQTPEQKTGAKAGGSPTSALFPGALADLQARGVVSGPGNPWMLAQSVFPQAQTMTPSITLDSLVKEAKQFFEV